MTITSWNVNSVRARLDRVLAWFERHQPDAACLQETKTPDDKFPRLEFEALGYTVETFGQKGYNGVALLAKGPLQDVTRGLPADDADAQKRMIAATFQDVRIVNVYVPNGASVGSEKFAFKLAWLDRLKDAVHRAHTPRDPLVICGDFNIAPEDRDVHDPQLWQGKVLCSEPEREKFRDLLEWGLVDALRLGNQETGVYTWWDYRMGGFRRDWGLRIDHFLVTEPVAGRVQQIIVDREERGGDKPSDHAPVTAVLE